MNSAKIYLSTTEKVSKIDLNARCVPLEAHYRSEARFHEEESSTLAEDSAEWWRVGPATKRRKNRGKRSISQSLARENASTGQSCALERVRDGRGAQVVGLRVHSCRMGMHLRLARFFFTRAVEQTHRMFQDWRIRARKRFFKSESRKKDFSFSISLRLGF